VGQIEMMANHQETLEIKIVPVVLKTTEAAQNQKAEEIYNKAIAATNPDGKNLNDTLNKVSLNQAGIKSTLIPNPKGAEKLVIDVSSDFKNYYDTAEKKLTEWVFTDNERDKTKNAGIKPKETIDEDGDRDFDTYKKEGTPEKTMLFETQKFLLDALKESYHSKYTKDFKGAIVFVSDLNYKGKENKGAYSESLPLRNQGVIIFASNAVDSNTYAHELGHMLGLPHSFVEHFDESNKSIKGRQDDVATTEKNIKSKHQDIKEAEEDSIVKEEDIKDIDKEIKKAKTKYEVADWNKTKTSKENDIKQNKVLIEGYEEDIKRQNEKLKIQKIKLKTLTGENLLILQAKTNNFMDYNNTPMVFTKNQVGIIKNDINFYQ
jgi:hypothetical protein